MKTEIKYLLKLPQRALFPAQSVLLYDMVLDQNPHFKKWAKQFAYRLALKSGEELKTLESLSSILNRLNRLGLPQTTDLTFVAAGGGSVGDFAGFIASTFLRGRRLIHLPSTWLAAVDSAHGGKNGLNFKGVKNQIGTFYPAEKIYICRDLLISQPEVRLQEALAEIIKISLVNDPVLFSFLEKNINQMNSDRVFKKLPQIVRNKYKIVAQDPLEKKGIRRLLNLGHTLGHVFESAIGCSHGTAVLLGLRFAVRWSSARKNLKEAEYIKILQLLDGVDSPYDLNTVLKKISLKKIETLLAKDKKLTEKSLVDFIFVRRVGFCFREKVSLSEILSEVERQKAFN